MLSYLVKPYNNSWEDGVLALEGGELLLTVGRIRMTCFDQLVNDPWRGGV